MIYTNLYIFVIQNNVWYLIIYIYILNYFLKLNIILIILIIFGDFSFKSINLILDKHNFNIIKYNKLII